MKRVLTSQGFSLIEILIVISIIAVLSALSLSFASILQKNARDAQRQSDLSALQSAIQQFYADQNHFPNTLVLIAGAALTNCTGESSCPTGVTKTYLSKTPKDPVSGTTTPYCYAALVASSNPTACSEPGGCHYYELCAKLENPSGTPVDCTACGLQKFRVTPL